MPISKSAIQQISILPPVTENSEVYCQAAFSNQQLTLWFADLAGR